ncbi:MAG: hypothetical protein H7A21_13405 [Spirochaetales bacterium]|nr:hypothetical protein [Leptospiraceae bacterium]MCP5482426.1 hypothetical protein [Spirochaetales bacterium]MCP5485870.1 hypothetical protein [Spirochaetales bacterium]
MIGRLRSGKWGIALVLALLVVCKGTPPPATELPAGPAAENIDVTQRSAVVFSAIIDYGSAFMENKPPDGALLTRLEGPALDSGTQIFESQFVIRERAYTVDLEAGEYLLVGLYRRDPQRRTFFFFSDLDLERLRVRTETGKMAVIGDLRVRPTSLIARQLGPLQTHYWRLLYAPTTGPLPATLTIMALRNEPRHLEYVRTQARQDLATSPWLRLLN